MGLKKIHNYFRNNWLWYHKWHNFKHSTVSHFLFMVGFIFVLLFIFILKSGLFSSEQELKTNASDNQSTLTAQADWQTGVNDGTDLTTSPADIKILAEGDKLDLLTIYNNDNNTIIATTNSVNRSLAIDNNLGTFWNVTTPYGERNSWVIDLTSSHTFAFLTLTATANETNSDNSGGPFVIQYSLDNVVHHSLCNTYAGTGPLSIVNSSTHDECTGTHPFEARYIELLSVVDEPNLMDIDIFDLGLYEARMSATHTSSPTQIGDVSSDPGRYVVEYNGFDTTETEPANTAIDYRFQLVNSSGVSTDGWTAWALGDVADLATTYPSQLTLSQTKIDAGETYLQVQSRLTTTDGVSTPTLSDYTASYHTNKAPNTPTPQ